MPAVSITFAVYKLIQFKELTFPALTFPATKFAVLTEPPVNILLVTLILCKIIPFVMMLPATTLPVTVILLNWVVATAIPALAFVKYKLLADSVTFAV